GFSLNTRDFWIKTLQMYKVKPINKNLTSTTGSSSADIPLLVIHPNYANPIGKEPAQDQIFTAILADLDNTLGVRTYLPTREDGLKFGLGCPLTKEYFLQRTKEESSSVNNSPQLVPI